MNNKLFFQDFVELLAEKAHISKKEAELFLRELFALATESVSQGEQLKIEGIGTFKSVWILPRSSVNVNTGEELIIPGHYRLTYTPSPEMREAVNAPFSCFSVEEILDDSSFASTTIHPVEPLIPEPSTQETLPVNNLPHVCVQEEEKDRPVVEESAVSASLRPIASPEAFSPEVEEEKTRNVVPKKTIYGILTASFTGLLVGILVVVGLYYYVINTFFSPDETELDDTEIILPPPPVTPAVAAADTVRKIDYPPTDTVTMAVGMRLSQLARKYLGHTSFWVYIYLENKQFSNPDNIPIGAKIYIPAKEKYNIVVVDSTSIRKAKEIGGSFVRPPR